MPCPVMAGFRSLPPGPVKVRTSDAMEKAAVFIGALKLTTSWGQMDADVGEVTKGDCENDGGRQVGDGEKAAVDGNAGLARMGERQFDGVVAANGQAGGNGP